MGIDNSTLARSLVTKTCKSCKRTFPADKAFFGVQPGGLHGLKTRCRLCSSPAWAGSCVDEGLLWARYLAPAGSRVCTRCKQAKPADPKHFFRHKMGRGGLMSECKQCHTERVRKLKPPRKTVPPGATKTCTLCGLSLPATDENFFRHPRGRYGFEAQCKRCKAERRDTYALRAYQKEWYAARAEEIQAQRKERALEDIERYRAMKAAHARNRRARIKGNGGEHSADDIAKIFEGQRGRCWWCSKQLGKNYHVDHRIPIARGGSNGPENLVISCPRCNQSKGTRMPWEMDVPRLF